MGGVPRGIRALVARVHTRDSETRALVIARAGRVCASAIVRFRGGYYSFYPLLSIRACVCHAKHRSVHEFTSISLFYSLSLSFSLCGIIVHQFARRILEETASCSRLEIIICSSPRTWNSVNNEWRKILLSYLSLTNGLSVN